MSMYVWREYLVTSTGFFLFAINGQIVIFFLKENPVRLARQIKSFARFCKWPI